MTKGELKELLDKGYITDVTVSSLAAEVLNDSGKGDDYVIELDLPEGSIYPSVQDAIYHAVHQIAKSVVMDDPHTPENDVHEREAEKAIEQDNLPLDDDIHDNDIEFTYIKEDAEPVQYTYEGDLDIKAVTALKSLGLKGKFFIGETQLKDELADVLNDAVVADHAIAPVESDPESSEVTE